MEKKSVETKNVPVHSKKKLLTISGIIGGILLISFIVMIIEGIGKNDLTIENNTDRNLEYVKLHFASMDTDFDSDVFFDQAINANETIKDKTPKLDLYGTDARLYVVFKFEGEEEQTIDNGSFMHNFAGKTLIEFNEENEGTVTLDVSIKEGLFGNSNNNECDEHWEYEFNQAQ